MIIGSFEAKRAVIRRFGAPRVQTPNGMGFPVGFQVTQTNKGVHVRLLVWHGSATPDGVTIVDAYPVEMIKPVE